MRGSAPLFGVVLLLLAGSALGDAIVVTRAMRAATIAEVSVEEDAVSVRLEIGVRDFESFRNLMPDEIYVKLGHEPAPLAERLALFFREDWVVRADGGDPLPGRIERIAGRRRVVRDDITGEPLPVQDEESEPVVVVEFRQPLGERPRRLTLRPPGNPRTGAAGADLGFVLYHRGIAVNDFRYLSREETVELDWEDPWYSAFTSRNLKRRFSAPIHAFLYVDHYEVRKEIIARPRDLQQWVDLGLEGKETIPVEAQEEIKRRVAEFLAAKSPVTVDGRAARGELDRIHFVRRTLRMTGVIDPPEELSIDSATLGVIYSYPIEALPKRVEMRWRLFSPRIDTVPTVATDEAGPYTGSVTPDDPVLVWQNFLTNPSKPGLIDVPPPPAGRRLPIPLLSLAALAAASVAFFALRRRSLLAAAGVGVACLAGVVLLRDRARVEVPIPLVGPASLTEPEVKEVTQALLRNVYGAFDRHAETAIYDTLSRSAGGDLLTRIYLETRKSLELENQGGARVKVKEVEVLKTETEPIGDGEGFLTRCSWDVTGSVGHWGHIHQRKNRYDARLTVRPVDGSYKITDIEVLTEKRL